MTNDPSAPRGRTAAGILSRPYLILTIASAAWGGNVVASKLAVGHIDPYALMLLRWVGALLLITPFAIDRLRADWPVLRRKWWLYLFYGTAGYATFNVFIYLAATYTSGINIALEQVTVNIFVLLLNFAFFRLRVRALQMVGVLATIIGVTLIATHGEPLRILALEVNIGDAMVVMACLSYAIYSIALRWRPPTHWMSFFIAAAAGAVVAALFYSVFSTDGIAALPANIIAVDLQGWLVVLYTALFPSIVSQVLYIRGVQMIGSNRASLFVNLVPLFGTVFSVLILGEGLQLFHFVAAALVAVGIFLAERSARHA